MSEILLENSKLSSQFGQNGGCLYCTQNSVANITTTSFDSIQVEETGAVVFAIDSVIRLSEVTISNSQAKSGAALFVSYDSSLEVSKSTFTNIYASTIGGILALSAFAEIKDSSFFNCISSSGSAVYADNSYIVIQNTVLENMQADTGAAIFALNDVLLQIYNTQILKCKSPAGGLITLTNNSNITMHSSTVDDFEGSAIVGDAADIELYDVNIQNGVALHT